MILVIHRQERIVIESFFNFILQSFFPYHESVTISVENLLIKLRPTYPQRTTRTTSYF